MAQVCLPAGCVEAIRFALVDECTGEPLAGASNGYVVDCIRNVTWTTNVEEGDETILKTDCGKKCWRTKNCDEVLNYTFEFQLLNPDTELTALLTGWPLLNDGVNNIGFYQSEDVDCQPWVAVEVFEQVPDESCTAAVKYRRHVFPKIRFQPPANEKEDPFRVLSWTGMTAETDLANFGDGPYNDSPFDFGTLPAGSLSQYAEVEDVLTEAPAGQCGFLTVPAQV